MEMIKKSTMYWANINMSIAIVSAYPIVGTLLKLLKF